MTDVLQGSGRLYTSSETLLEGDQRAGLRESYGRQRRNPAIIVCIFKSIRALYYITNDIRSQDSCGISQMEDNALRGPMIKSPDYNFNQPPSSEERTVYKEKNNVKTFMRKLTSLGYFQYIDSCSVSKENGFYCVKSGSKFVANKCKDRETIGLCTFLQFCFGIKYELLYVSSGLS